MAATSLKIFCIMNGDSMSESFYVKISPNDTVADLKVAIRLAKWNILEHDNAFDLRLWLATVPIGEEDMMEMSEDNAQEKSVTVTLDGLTDKEQLYYPRKRLSKIFSQDPDDHTYIFVERYKGKNVQGAPVHADFLMDVDSAASSSGSQGSGSSHRVVDEQWQRYITALELDFFALESIHYKNLASFLKKDAKIPTTGGEMDGLPCIPSRDDIGVSRPSFLFLNLPEPTTKTNSSSTSDKALTRIRRSAFPLLPMFGVSGSGKTRTAIEMLCKNWGFYFNGSDTDLGSEDLLSLIMTIQNKRYRTNDLEGVTHVKILALALVLARIIILDRCLDIAQQENVAFTCRDWMLLQVTPMDTDDIFSSLFMRIMNDIQKYSPDITAVAPLTQKRFFDLRHRLMDSFEMPQKNGYKILIVVDEAQNLGKYAFGEFLSQSMSVTDEQRAAGAAVRPILSPFVHGLYQVSETRSLLCVVPCGTDLSIFDLEWLTDSAPIAKGQVNRGPFIDFQGWGLLKSVKDYRDCVRRSLLSEHARSVFDVRAPEESVPELYKRLRGRFRPIVSAIEVMLMPSTNDWRDAIKQIEERLTVPEGIYFYKGNIAYDISRMIKAVACNPQRYAIYQNVQTVLKTFVLQHYLTGNPVLLNTQEAPLVEASVGRILLSDSGVETVLDEPFALLAAKNYFEKFDPQFHSWIGTMLSSGRNASVHGNQWEFAVLPSLAYAFHGKILSQTALVPEGSTYDPILGGRADIVGFANHRTLGVTHGGGHRALNLEQFLEAHIFNGSYRGGEQVPPFFSPREDISGPDVVFVLHVESHGYCPVFVQLKLRHSMSAKNTKGAFNTVNSKAVQCHIEVDLEKFCTGPSPRFLGVVIAYPAGIPTVDGTFKEIRRSPRNHPAPGELRNAPKCVSLRIDESNIRHLFPENHIIMLDILKDVKRKREGYELVVDEPKAKRLHGDKKPKKARQTPKKQRNRRS
ncbi:hypothetical protein EMPS_09113 [Entomortierella parvispora]|uniref:Crinkler effector protein N-terminal domain-containing protein n=1 Tax=Entomortierella parvispora TaxID=205924 RepID=A0A9P3HHC5_9FUNG|nr:hypothetical protein EMPS_09113 [Entomortierella parvispora]